MAQKPTPPPQPDDQAVPPDQAPADTLAAPPLAPPPGLPGGSGPVEPEPPPRRSRRGLKITLGVVAGVVVLLAAGLVVVVLLAGEEIPEVGECLTDSADPTDLEVVDCGADQAAWRVVGHDGSRTEDEFDQADRAEICQAFPDWENALWLRTNLFSGEGEVVCLVAAGAAPAE